MNRISYKISLEDFRSRQNGVIPSVNEDGEVSHFNKESMLSTTENTLGNYGMFPSDFGIPSDAECEDVLKYLKNIGWETNVVSYNTLSRWYSLMNDYIRRVNLNGECKGEKTEEIAEEEKEFFYSLGGYAFHDWLERNVFPKFNADKDVYEGLDNYSMNPFQVMEEYAFLMGCKKDFSGKSESDISKEDCCRYSKYLSHGGENLILDIEKWVKGLPAWGNNLFRDVYIDEEDEGIENEKVLVKILVEFESYISLNIPIQDSVEDLGEMEMLAEDWSRMANYRVGREDNESGSTVVIYNGNSWIFSAKTDSDEKGYYYSDYYKEAYFANTSGMTDDERLHFEQVKEQIFPSGEAEPQWIEYFNLYKDKFKSQDEDATYSIKDGICVFNPTPLKMSEEQEIIHFDNGAILYYGEICELESHPYIEDNDGKKIPIIYDDENSLRPYAALRNDSVYGTFVKFVDGMPLWRFLLTSGNTVEAVDFSFRKTERGYPRRKTKNGYNEIHDEIKFALVNGDYVSIDNFTTKEENLKLIFNDYVEIDGEITPIIDNKFYYEYDKGFLKEKELTYGAYSATSKNMMESSSIRASKTHGYYFDENGKLFVHEPYGVYSASQVEGTTRSDLDIFESDMKFFDNLGNELNGLIPRDSSGAYRKPSALSVIEIPYVVGTTRNLTEILLDEEELEKIYSVTSIDAKFLSEGSGTTKGLIVEETSWPADGLKQVNSYTEKKLRQERVKIVKQRDSEVFADESSLQDIDTEQEPTTVLNCFVGDILESIEYYYCDSMGNKVVSIKLDNDDFELDGDKIVYKHHIITRDLSKEGVEYNDKLEVSSGYMHSSSAITLLNQELESYKNKNLSFLEEEKDEEEEGFQYNSSKEISIHGHIYSDIFCDIIYYKGATLEQTRNFVNNGIYSLTKLFNGGDTAIQYTDTCGVVKDWQDFWVNDYLSYSIQYYLLNRETNDENYLDAATTTYITKFKAPLILSGDSNGDFIATPTFRRESNLGVQDESVVGDIYINRGICQSIDRHLKLMSCKSLYNLEEYGNNYFNVESEQ